MEHRILLGILLNLFFKVINPLDLNSQSMDGDIHIPEEFSVAFINICQVEISGNKRTEENVIIRELDFQPDSEDRYRPFSPGRG